MKWVLNVEASDGGSVREYRFDDKPEETVMHNGAAYRYGGLAEGEPCEVVVIPQNAMSWQLRQHHDLA